MWCRVALTRWPLWLEGGPGNPWSSGSHAVPSASFLSFCMCVGACVFVHAQALFLSLPVIVFTPTSAQFAAIFFIYSHLLKSKVLSGEAFCFTFRVPAGAWVGGMWSWDHRAGPCWNTKAKSVKSQYPHLWNGFQGGRKRNLLAHSSFFLFFFKGPSVITFRIDGINET